MPAVRVIPCLDVRDGRVVKGVRFQGLRDMGDPADQAEAYGRQGADEIVMLDVTATLQGRLARARTVEEIRRRLNIPLTVGGGMADAAEARRLLECGADKVSVNSAAVRRPELLAELAALFGSQCVVLAIDGRRDAEGRPRVLSRSGSREEDLDVVAWARRGVELGAGEILLTSWDRDGTGSGYDLDLLAEVRAAVSVPLIASGGAADPGHMAEAAAAGADAVLAATIFHDGTWTVQKVKAELADWGVEVRI